MLRGLFTAVAFVMVAGAFAACSAENEAPGAGGKLTADELEEFLLRADSDGREYDCRPLKRDGWDYVCTFTDEGGRRMNIDVAVNATQATRSSGVYAADASDPVQPTANAAAMEKWLAKVNALCAWAKGGAAKRREPQTLEEFEQYVLALRDINERYRRKLAALPPPPDPDNTETFATLLLHLEEDQRLATGLLAAVRADDGAAMADYFERLQLQAVEENRLFARMGACPAATG